MNTLTIVFSLLSVLSAETSSLYALSPRSHTSPASALMNRNQAESSEEDFRFPWISDARMRSSKVVSPCKCSQQSKFWNSGILRSLSVSSDARCRLEGDKVAERSDRRGLPEATRRPLHGKQLL